MASMLVKAIIAGKLRYHVIAKEVITMGPREQPTTTVLSFRYLAPRRDNPAAYACRML
jgi:hypothetical protein